MNDKLIYYATYVHPSKSFLSGRGGFKRLICECTDDLVKPAPTLPFYVEKQLEL